MVISHKFSAATVTTLIQAVITEHVDIGEIWYKGAIAERWRGGNRLVPDDWSRA